MHTNLRLFALFFVIALCSFSSAANIVPILDTIVLKSEYVEGRWIEKSADEKHNIYIFRADNTFHKAADNGELLFFNVVGRYTLSGDSIKIVYQDFSRQNSQNARVKTMHLQVIALSEDELNINKTENNRTQFIRLRRQK